MKRLFSRKGKGRAEQAPGTKHLSPLDATAHNLKPTLPAKYLATAVPHPHPFDRLLVLACPEGLLLRPDIPHYDALVKISWGKDAKVEEIEAKSVAGIPDWSSAAIVYGVVGIVRLFTDAYILFISNKMTQGIFLEPEQEVFSLTRIADIPLRYDRATRTINLLNKRTNNLTRSPATIDPDIQEDGASGAPAHIRFSPSTDERYSERMESTEGNISQSGSSTPIPLSSRVDSQSPAALAKALAAKLSFWSPQPSGDSLTSLSGSESGQPPSPALLGALLGPTPTTIEKRHSELEDKILREILKQYTKSGMYFAYTFDVTSSIAQRLSQNERTRREHRFLADLEVQSPDSATSADVDLSEPRPTLPLWRKVDHKYWWNEHLLQDFIEAGLHSYVLPLVQGHWQTVQFNVPIVSTPSVEREMQHNPSTGSTTIPVSYTVISRRSRERAGLRYQRRGVDDSGNVANFVESETLTCVTREGRRNIFSFLQIRGSIPLYWSQSGYNLKPPPLVSPDKTKEQQLDILKKHLGNTVSCYGPHTIVNLAEQHGKEGALTEAYKTRVSECPSSDINYCGYDFHAETKGMRYERISKLMERLRQHFEEQGYTWINEGALLSKQHGVFRVNCIDCLDRTNVVQSAIARQVLQHQLSALAITSVIPNLPHDINALFNDVWANNGDAISRAYAGTSALKGDFTRTGKRDITGMLNDGMNSLSRMYSSTFSDWFSQAVIDYMLGYRSISVFAEFLHNLSAAEPGELLKISKVRLSAIENCSSLVLSEGESLQYGWTLLSPMELNTRMGGDFEEKVLLLSSKALYIARYDYHLETVQMFTRVPIEDIQGLQKGAYILSSLEEGSRDVNQNYGFLVRFSTRRQTIRVTSYSMRNTVDDVLPTLGPTKPSNQLSTSASASPEMELASLSNILSKAATEANRHVSYVAFKALPVDVNTQYLHTGVENTEWEQLTATDCRQAVDFILRCIMRTAQDRRPGSPLAVEHKDIVSLVEARQNASLYSKMEYGVKRLLWLGG